MNALRIAGYAALFGVADAGHDTILPGAFRDTLAARRTPYPLYWQHHPEQRIGWVEAVGEDGGGARAQWRVRCSTLGIRPAQYRHRPISPFRGESRTDALRGRSEAG